MQKRIYLSALLTTSLLLSVGCAKSKEESMTATEANADTTQNVETEMMEQAETATDNAEAEQSSAVSEEDIKTIQGQTTIFITYFTSGETEKAYEMLDDTAKSDETKKAFEDGMAQTKTLFGDVVAVEPIDANNITEIQSVGYGVSVECEYADLIVTYTVTLNQDMKFMSVYASNTAPKNTRTLPSELTEEEVIVDAGKGYPLDGLLTLPADVSNPVPAVVLVHGSGPNDKNETIGANTVFDQLAYGLAQQGIAVLRYDKRTYAYGSKMAETPDILKNMTVEDETIEDAIAGIDLLKNDTRFSNVYIVGHSQGAILAPRIVSETEGVSGIVSLAGSPRKFFDIVKQQIIDRAALVEDQSQTTILLEALDADQKIVDALPSMSDDEAKETVISTLGVTGYYLKDFDRLDPVTLIETEKIPVLFLQGSMDRQIFEKEDFDLWKTSLQNYDKATYKLYPNLNHLFIPYTENDFLNSYQTAGDIPQEVMTDIATWIKQQ